MSRLPVEGYIISAQDPSKHLLEYTSPLTDNTLFPFNSKLPEKTFLCYGSRQYGIFSDRVIFNNPARDSLPSSLDYTATYLANSETQKTVLYRIDGYRRDTYNNGAIAKFNDLHFRPNKTKRIGLYDETIFDSSESPSQVKLNGNTAFAYGFEYTGAKGVSYSIYKPVVNYNPNKIVVIPYLAHYYNDATTGQTKSYSLSGLNYVDRNILMLDDILNDTIISGLVDGEYCLKYALLIEGTVYYNNGYTTSGSGSNAKYVGYYLCPTPITLEQPMLKSYLYHRYDGNIWYTSICQDFYSPIWNGQDILIGVDIVGVGSNLANNAIIDVKTTSYSHTGVYTLGTYEVYDETEADFVPYSVTADARPYVSVAELSGANRELYDNLVNTVATLGMAFATSWAAVNDIKANLGITSELLDEYPNSIYYPRINNKGQVEGTDSGRAAKTNPLKEAGDEGTNPFDTVPVINPDDEEDTNEYIDEIPIKTHLSVNPSNAFNTRYALSENDLIKFEDFLWTGNQSMVSNVLDGLKMFGENPMNFFLSLKMFPFDVTPYATTHSGQLTFGNGVVVTDSNDDPIIVTRLTDANIVVDLGTIDFRKYFKNFMDYEPYTTAKLYIPFCGEVSVQTSIFVGHKINIKLIVDIITGACCAVVYCDKIACLYLNGNAAVDIAITGENFQEYMTATKNFLSTAGKALDSAVSLGLTASGGGSSGTSTSTSVTSSSTAGVSGGRVTGGYSGGTNKMNNIHSGTSKSEGWNESASVNGLVSGLFSSIMGAYEWYNTPTALQISGTSSDLCNLYKPLFAYFVLEQPVPMPAPGYADTYGYACFEYGTLPPDGLVICRNAHVQPSTATEPETTELNELLNTGVWI